MAGVQLPPNSTGTVLDTVARISGKEMGVAIPPLMISINHTPVAATQATISAPAGAAGVRNVAYAISAHLITAGTAETTKINLNLRDGATGAGTILMSWSLLLTTNTFWKVDLVGLHIPGTAATAMTLEFSAAGDAATLESVNLVYYTLA